MADTIYSNGELSLLYREIILTAGRSVVDYTRYIKAVQTADLPIHPFYREHGSLRDLAVEGIGPKIKESLELILEHGIDKAREIAERKKIDDMREETQRRAWPMLKGGRITREQKRSPQ